VFHTVLFSGKSNPLVRKTVSGYFRNFFSKFVQQQNAGLDSSRSFTPIIGTHGAAQVSIFANKMALRALLGVVQHLRSFESPQEFKGSLKTTPFDNNFWLEIKYLDIAKAAQHCGAYLTSILFTEIAATEVDMYEESFFIF
jgi:ataxia telangiectasia mutated family protein